MQSCNLAFWVIFGFFPKKVDTHFSRRYREDIERIDKKNADPKIHISTHPHTFKSRSVSVAILHYYIKKSVETKISLLSGFIYEGPQSYDNFLIRARAKGIFNTPNKNSPNSQRTGRGGCSIIFLIYPKTYVCMFSLLYIFITTCCLI